MSLNREEQTRVADLLWTAVYPGGVAPSTAAGRVLAVDRAVRELDEAGFLPEQLPPRIPPGPLQPATSANG